MISNLKSVKENQEYLKSVLSVDRRDRINWKNSVGCEIEYKYNWKGGVSKGVLKIVKYEVESEKVYFEGYEKGIKTGNLTMCRLGNMLCCISSEFKYDIGITIGELTIIDREYREKGQKYKYYKYKCNKCGNEDWILESNLLKGRGCNACTNRKAVLGINTIWDLTPWMMDYGISEEDAKTHTPNSNKEVNVKCPNCGKIKKIAPNKIHQNHSIQCSCGDGVSYPEKLMENVLIQLGIKYERQYKTNWSQNKVYDFYLTDYNTIIETHGIQHYEENKSFTRRTLKEEQENDKLKEELALGNGVEHYIIIDSRKSTLNWIKNNILNSKLNIIFDLNKVNWIECEEYATSNLVKEICDYYREHHEISTSNLAKKFNVSKPTVINYLKKGAKLGICKYDGKEEMKRSGECNGGYNKKTVSQFTFKGVWIKTYSSTHEAEKETGIASGNISACCLGKRKTAGGFIWRYAE